VTDDRFSVHLTGHYDVNGSRIACPNCGADRGLTYYALLVNAEALVSCTFGCGNDWWDKRITGETLYDLYLALTGQPTLTTTVWSGDTECPREPCGECTAIKTELAELGVLASAADGNERAALGARSAALLGAWCGHLADTHLGAAEGAAP